MSFKSKEKKSKKQLEFNIEKPLERDRNHNLGGKSFYFFDFDENIAFLNTSTVLFHKTSHQEIKISGKEFSEFQKDIGVKGKFKDYIINAEDVGGSFKNYRDQEIPRVLKWFGKKQAFVADLISSLKTSDDSWQGPSWSCFYHAVFNKRPIALITARGHAPETIKEGIKQLVKFGYLPYEPNYLGVYPVNDPKTKKLLLGGNGTESVAALKKLAIKHAFSEAIRLYGNKPHRFGMSDDCRYNIESITEAMQDLKLQNPDISFFVIETSGGKFVKKELPYPTKDRSTTSKQLELSVDTSFPLT